jgi:hypothetical protein
MSYRQQVQTLFRLQVDPAFARAFHADAALAAPALSSFERAALLELPPPAETTGASSTSAFARIGIRERCRIALPRTYAELEKRAHAAGESVETAFLREADLWRPVPEGFDRDALAPNPAVHWAETARVLQMSNRIFWQFYVWASTVARTDATAPPYLADLAEFEFDTLARRVALYRRFAPPGPRALPEGRRGSPRLSRYAELARYAYSVRDAVPRPYACGAVFLYNGQRLRVLEVDEGSAAALAILDGGVGLDGFSGRPREVLEALAGLGVLE